MFRPYFEIERKQWANAILETIYFNTRSTMPVSIFTFSNTFCCNSTIVTNNLTNFHPKLASGESVNIISANQIVNLYSNYIFSLRLTIVQNQMKILTGSPAFNIYILPNVLPNNFNLRNGLKLSVKPVRRKTANQVMDKTLQTLSQSVVIFASSFDNFSLFLMSFTKAYVQKSNILVQLFSNKETLALKNLICEIISFSVSINSDFDGGRREKEHLAQLKACNDYRLHYTSDANTAKLWEINCININLRDELNLSRIINTSLGIQYDYGDHIYKTPNYRIISWGSHARKFNYKVFLRSDSFLISMSGEALVKTMDQLSLICLFAAFVFLFAILHISGLETGWVLLIAEVFENGLSLTKQYMKFAVPLILWSFGNILLRQFYASDMVSNLAIPPSPVVPATLESLLKYRKEIPTVSYSYECLRNNSKNKECRSARWNSLLRPGIYQINEILDKIGLIVVGSPMFTRNFIEDRNISSDFAVFCEDEGMQIFEKVFDLLMTLVKGYDSFKLVSSKHDSIESRIKYWTMPKSVFEAPVTKVLAQLEECGIVKKIRQLGSSIKIMNYYSVNVNEVLKSLDKTDLEMYKELILNTPRWAAYFSSDFDRGKNNQIPTTFQPFKAKSLQLIWYLYFTLEILASVVCGMELTFFMWSKRCRQPVYKMNGQKFSYLR